jgi:hypothetical protein
MSKQSHEPAYRAFTVIKREGADDFWLPIGAAFFHGEKSGGGMNVILQALPLPGPDGVCKIVLRPPRDDQQQEDDRQPERDRTPRKSGQQRR